MNWPQLIAEIEASGLKPKEIAARAGCSQAYVSQLKKRRRLTPGFGIGTAIVVLHRERVIAAEAPVT